MSQTGTNPVLHKNDVHVWRFFAGDFLQRLDEFTGMLSSDEQTRAERFYYKRDQERFVVNRGITRVLLARYLHTKPQDIDFSYNPHGKPRLSEPRHGNVLRFNLSHSDELTLVALTLLGEIGIDTERVRDNLDVVRLSERFFHHMRREKSAQLH